MLSTGSIVSSHTVNRTFTDENPAVDNDLKSFVLSFYKDK